MHPRFDHRAALITALVFGLVFVLAACGGGNKQAAGGGDGITVVLKDYQFVPDTISLTKGQTAKLTLKNEAQQEHDFVVDELNINEKVPAGETKTIEVTPDKAGTFDLYCSVPGHKEAGMVGKIEVK